MGISLAINNKDISVIAYIDDAVTCTREEYDEYLKTLDESLLKLDASKDAPVKFVMRRSLRMDHLQKIKEIQATIKNSQVQINMAYTLLEIKYALVDIVNGTGPLKYRRDSDGGASDELVSVLDSSGLLNDLLAARNNALSVGEKASPKSS
jgi:hypothetical protein